MVATANIAVIIYTEYLFFRKSKRRACAIHIHFVLKIRYMVKFFAKLWRGWKVLGRKMGELNFLILMSLFYFFILPPFCLYLFLSNLLKKKKKRSFWIQRASDGSGRYNSQF